MHVYLKATETAQCVYIFGLVCKHVYTNACNSFHYRRDMQDVHQGCKLLLFLMMYNISTVCYVMLFSDTLFSPEMEMPYRSQEKKIRLLDLYRNMHRRIHSVSRPMKLIYHSTDRETLLAWVCANQTIFSSSWFLKMIFLYMFLQYI